MKPANSGMKILLVDDEEDMRRILKADLEAEGYRVVDAGNGQAALDLFHKAKPDFVILDVMIPQIDGLEVLRRIRLESRVPVVLLTAKAKEVDRILGIRLGADDYVLKPFSVGELIARVQAIWRRARAPADGEALSFAAGALSVDFSRCEVRVAGRRAALTPKELSLLKLLIEAEGKVLSRELLLERIWGYDGQADIDTRTVDQHVARLRRKLKTEGRRIATVSKSGYRFLGSKVI
ncbi:MAG TPA: response regulator transcription factor [Elusimicrobiota bacterium]|nr:response regulator transcription factor [Elusimicrobiota bacterium]